MKKKAASLLLTGLLAVLSAFPAAATSPFTAVDGSSDPAPATEAPVQSTGEARESTSISTTSLLRYDLTPVGTLTDPSRDFYFTRGALLIPDGKGGYAFADRNGQPLVDSLADVDYLENGIYEVQQSLEETDVNKTGLVTSDGEVLLSPSVAGLATPKNREQDIRFLAAIIATEQTDNESECIIYFTSDWFSLSVGEDDVMYEGYVRVFDLQRKQFVEGVEYDNYTRNGLIDLGDSFVLEHDGKYTMFDADGNQLWETDGYINGATYSAIAVSVSGNYYIVDHTGTDTFKADYSVSDVSAENDYFSCYLSGEENPYQVIDLNGNVIVPTTFPIIFRSDANYFESKNDATNAYYVTDRNGTVVLDQVDTFSNVLGSYSFASQVGTEDITLFTPAGITSGLTAESQYNLTFSVDHQLVALNTGAPAIPFTDDDYVQQLAPGLVSINTTTSSGKSASLYDLFTGTQLLSGYASLQVAGDTVYVTSDNETYDVYHLTLGDA